MEQEEEIKKLVEEKSSIESKKPFWKRHFLKLLLLLLLIVSVAWGYFGKRQIITDYEQQIENLKESQKTDLREAKADYIKDLSTVFALAVRSEMIADNLNQVDQYFLQIVKLFDVERILLVNPNNGKVILSTNKKDEDTIFDNETLLKTNQPIVKVFNNSSYSASPIMGLNEQLGVLIIQIN